MFYFHQALTFPVNSPCFLYNYSPNIYPFYNPQNLPFLTNIFSQSQPISDQNGPNNEQQFSVSSIQKMAEGKPIAPQSAQSAFSKKSQILKAVQINKNQPNRLEPVKNIKLYFRIQWNNEHRNIIPNLTNHMISFVFKKSKSQVLVKKLFLSLSQDIKWTEKRFYLYMKKIKESVTHYLNQNVLLKFLEIHEPTCQLYDYEQQIFYMRICRILIIKFLQNEAILIPLTSNRMSSAKRKIHLIAREALKRSFLLVCQQKKN